MVSDREKIIQDIADDIEMIAVGMDIECETRTFDNDSEAVAEVSVYADHVDVTDVLDIAEQHAEIVYADYVNDTDPHLSIAIDVESTLLSN